RELPFEQRFAFHARVAHDVFGKACVVAKFRDPLGGKAESLAIRAEAVILELLVQEIELPLALADRLMDRLAQMRYERVIEAQLEVLKLSVPLDEHVVLEEIEDAVDLSSKLTNAAEEILVVDAREARVNDRIGRAC